MQGMAAHGGGRNLARSGNTQSLPSLRMDPSRPEMTALPSLSSTLSLPALNGRQTYQKWSASAAVLTAHQDKLPFLQLPMPSRETRLCGDEEMRELIRDKVKINVRLQYLVRGGKMPPLAGLGVSSGKVGPGYGLGASGSPKMESPLKSSTKSRANMNKRKGKIYASHAALHKREAQQAALALDRQFVLRGMEHLVEQTEDRKKRELHFDHHWWEAMYQPIPGPRERIASLFQDRTPLPPPISHSSRAPVHSHVPGQGAEREFTFDAEEMEDIISVCKKFTTFTTPSAELEDYSDQHQAVLSRPAFCRLVYAMSGLSVKSEARTRLHDAVLSFDQHAEYVPVKGCSAPGGCVVGFGLAHGGMNEPEARDLPILNVFSDIMRNLIADVPEAIKFMDQRQDMARQRLLTELVPQARRFAKERIEYIQRHLHNSICTKPAEPGSPAAAGSIAAETSSAISGTVGLRRAGTEATLEGGEPAAPSGGGRGVKVLRQSPTSANRASVEGKKSGNASPTCESSDTEAEDKDEEISESTSLYGHTFAVLKGELLMSQLLEPEILDFLVEFRTIFHELFTAYVDIPMPNSEGHMTLSAFLQCCNDFGLFPTQVDFRTLQWIYDTAESCLNVQGQRLSVSPKVAVSLDVGGDTPSSVSSAVRITAKSFGPLGGSKKLPRSGGGGGQTSVEAGRRKGRSRTGTLDRSPTGRMRAQSEVPEVLWCGKWIKAHLAWLTQDRDDRTSAENRSADILSGVNEWMLFRRLSLCDILAFLSPDKVELPNQQKSRGRSGSKVDAEAERDGDVIPMEVLPQAIEFMKLEEPPSPEELQQMMDLIKGPREDIDFGLMKDVFRIINRIKENLERATNLFLKDASAMSQAEYSSCMFFQELMLSMEQNKWTPQQLFRKIDVDGSGRVDKVELVREVKSFMKTQPIPMKKPVPTDHPFDILDLNYDGEISEEEFVLVFEQAKHAQEVQKHAEIRHPIFASTHGLSTASPSGRRIFGRRAFVECLLKIALVHLSFHGTTHQAEQTSLFKASWLLMYLHWNFERAKTAPKPSQQNGKALVLKPKQRLLRDSPDLFSKAGPPRDPACSDVWGGEADKLVQQCFEDPVQPKAAGCLSLDGQLLAMAVG